MAIKGKTTSKPTVAKTAPAKPKAAAKKTVKKTATRVPAADSAKRAKGDSIALFIDLDNTNASVPNVLEIISILRPMGNVVYGKFYGYTDAAAGDFEEIVHEHGFDTAGKLRFKSDKFSVVDTRLLFDAVSLTEKNKFKTVFVWTGVGELIPLFARLKDLGAKVLTVDLPEFDSKNKFVTQAIRLYSPYTFAGARKGVYKPDTAASIAAPRSYENASAAKSTTDYTPKADLTTDLLASAPELPRKAGAPELGSSENVAISTEEEFTPEEAHEFYMGLASKVFQNYEEDLKKDRMAASMAELTPVDIDPISTDSPDSSAEEVADAPWLTPEPAQKAPAAIEDAPLPFDDDVEIDVAQVDIKGFKKRREEKREAKTSQPHNTDISAINSIKNEAQEVEKQGVDTPKTAPEGSKTGTSDAKKAPPPPPPQVDLGGDDWGSLASVPTGKGAK